jgi:hypothetical protein
MKMAERPRRARVSEESRIVHLVARTHDDNNEIVTLCGQVAEGIWTGGTWICERCEETIKKLHAEYENLLDEGMGRHFA